VHIHEYRLKKKEEEDILKQIEEDEQQQNRRQISQLEIERIKERVPLSLVEQIF